MNTTIDYYYDAGWQVVEERVDGDVHTQYLWCPSYIDTPVLRRRDTSEVPNQTLNETLYYTVDANKSVTGLIDGTPGSSTEGQVVERYLYDPYGRVMFLKPDWSLQEVTGPADGTASALGNEILFTGYRYNPETGYYQVRHREFNPLMGRWMQRDPLGYVDGGNLYEYVRSGPVDGVDASGTRTVRWNVDSWLLWLWIQNEPPPRGALCTWGGWTTDYWTRGLDTVVVGNIYFTRLADVDNIFPSSCTCPDGGLGDRWEKTVRVRIDWYVGYRGIGVRVHSATPSVTNSFCCCEDVRGAAANNESCPRRVGS